MNHPSAHDERNIIIEQGINRKGFGHVAKKVMTDPNLAITAKGIYAYLSSMAGSGDSSFTSRRKILSHLNIGERAYDSNLQKLLSAGYIIREQSRRENGSFGTTIIQFVMKPEHLQEQISYAQCHENKPTMYSGTVYALGWGSISRLVMQDPAISIKAKALYAYFCAYAGIDSEAFPDRQRILRELGIGKNMYNNYRKELEAQNYITTMRCHTDGKLAGNIFRINFFPDPTKNSRQLLVFSSPEPDPSQVPQNSSAVTDIPQNSSTAVQLPQNSSTVMQIPQNSSTVHLVPQNSSAEDQVPQNECTVHECPEKQRTEKGSAPIITNNNIQTNNSTQTMNNSILLDRLMDRVRSQIEYRILCFAYESTSGGMAGLDALVVAVAKVLASASDRTMIGNRAVMTATLKNDLMQINMNHAVQVLDRYLCYVDRVKDPESYLLASIYNEICHPTPVEEEDDDLSFG